MPTGAPLIELVCFGRRLNTGSRSCNGRSWWSSRLVRSVKLQVKSFSESHSVVYIALALGINWKPFDQICGPFKSTRLSKSSSWCLLITIVTELKLFFSGRPRSVKKIVFFSEIYKACFGILINIGTDQGSSFRLHKYEDFSHKLSIEQSDCPIWDHSGNGKTDWCFYNSNERICANQGIAFECGSTGCSQILFAVQTDQMNHPSLSCGIAIGTRIKWGSRFAKAT